MQTRILAIAALFLVPAWSGAATIDRMTFGDLGGSSTYNVASGFAVTPWRSQFFRSDGIVVPWGAGVTGTGRFALLSATVDGGNYRYEFDPASALFLMDYTDFSFGDYGSTGTLVAAGPLVVTAVIGSNVATLDGLALIAANGLGYPEPRGALYSAPVGSIVPLQMTYRLVSGTWGIDTFDATFSYRSAGAIDFAPVPLPAAAWLFGGALGLLGAIRRRRDAERPPVGQGQGQDPAVIHAG